VPKFVLKEPNKWITSFEKSIFHHSNIPLFPVPNIFGMPEKKIFQLVVKIMSLKQGGFFLGTT
jgi:hypothetical protein